jgi:predicted O-methyltransferase YrrM
MVNNFFVNSRLEYENRNIPIITPNTENFIEKLLLDYKPKNCLEIWSAVAYSTIFIASRINQWNGNITSFEISYPAYKEWLNNIDHNNIYNIKTYNLDFTSVDISKIIWGKLDFVFIDAMKKQYLTYFQMLIPYLKKWSIVLFDDVIKFKDKINTLYWFFKNNQLNYKIFKLDDDDGVLIVYV